MSLAVYSDGTTVYPQIRIPVAQKDYERLVELMADKGVAQEAFELLANLKHSERLGIHKVEKLGIENKRLKEALQSLYDEQNGPPLERDREGWEKAIRMAEEVLQGGIV